MKSEIILVGTCDIMAGHEDELNRWYNEVHIRDILNTCPGFLSARRYECTYGEPRYLALYELATEDALTTPELERIRGFGPLTPYVRGFSVRTYRQTFEAFPPS